MGRKIAFLGIALSVVGLGAGGAYFFWQETRVPIPRLALSALGSFSGLLVIFGVLMGIVCFLPREWRAKSLWAFIAVGAGIGLFTGVGLGFLTWRLTASRYEAVEPRKNPTNEAPANLVKNGEFELDTEFWGTGYLEEFIRNGRHPEEEQRLPYVVTEPKGSKTKTISSGQSDPNKSYGLGVASFRFDHKSSKGKDRTGSLSQRINGLIPHKFYVITFQVSAKDAADHSFFVTPKRNWKNRKYIPAGTYDWQLIIHDFAAEEDHIDLRFVAEAPCTVWIDDVTLTEKVK